MTVKLENCFIFDFAVFILDNEICFVKTGSIVFKFHIHGVNTPKVVILFVASLTPSFVRLQRFKGVTTDDLIAGNKNSTACLYRTQLAINNKTFNDDHSMWQPYVHSTESQYTRCKPVAHTAPDR